MKTTCPVTPRRAKSRRSTTLAVIGQSRPSGESLVSPLPVEMSTQQYEQRSRWTRPRRLPMTEDGKSSSGKSEPARQANRWRTLRDHLERFPALVK
jgi:hypothetical protein